MNERIRELAEQAGLRFTQLMSNPMVPVVDGKETDLEKFAELIVLECIREIGYKSAELLDIDFYPHYQERLKKYFGVEE